MPRIDWDEEADDFDDYEVKPPKDVVCSNCGALQDNPEVAAKLRDLYSRLISGVQNYEPLVFTGDWMQENVFDEEDHQAVMGAMERDMHNRGLCPKCGLPDLRGKTEKDFHSEEDMKEMQEMWAIEAAERRAGC
jgi:hypothetical protein